MKPKLFRLFALIMVLSLIVTPVSALPVTEISSASSDVRSFRQLQSSDPSLKIDPKLLSQLEVEGKANGFILFKEQADLNEAYEIKDWVARGQFVVDTLQETAERSQRNILNLLKNNNVAYTSFWINNSVYVTADLDIFNQLVSYPEVFRIESEKVFEIPQPEPEEVLAAINAVEWGIASIMADQVWADFGIFGDGIVVGSIDTGVQYNHPALVNQYRGNLGGGSFDHNYNWHDPSNICGNPSLIPCDNNGHGTHVTGTMVGDDGGSNQIGVAPGAKWIAAKGCESNSCSEFALLSSGEWILAPTDLYGDNPDVAKRPHIINNSWGGGNDNNPWYQSTVQAWVAAQIFPAFAIGNAGPTCGSAGNPGNMPEAYAAGGYNSSDGIYISSSRGPSAWGGIIKPNISAPGQSVRSSVPTNNYATYSGTSMASPHVSGAVALMWSASPVLAGDIEATRAILDQTARDRDPIACGGTTENNNDWGQGQLDAYVAVSEAIAQSNAGTLEGTVTESGSGDPIQGATIMVDGPYILSTTTNALGEYSLLVPEGTYDVTAIKYGYVSQTVTDVEIFEDETTVVDFVLDLADTYTVSGTVTDINTGWPLYTSLNIVGYPESPVWSDPETGEYSVDLVGGFEFTFHVNAWVDGYLTESRSVGPLDDDAVENLALDVDGLSCTAPGYSLDYLYYEDFDADNGGFIIEGPSPAPWQWGTPVTWPSTCVEGTNCWGTNLNGNYNHNANQSILSPLIDLSAVSPGEELYARWYQALHIENSWWDNASAEYRVDGGSWQIMWEHTEGTIQVPWTEKVFDVSAAAGGTLQFRFRFTSDVSVNYAGYYIDMLSIVSGEDCLPIPGGLIVGNVYDGNTMDGLVGAMVAGDFGKYTLTVATPLDPDVDDGFYTIFAPQGAVELTASKSGYSPDSAVLMVGDGETVRQDFVLSAGYLEADPDELVVDVLFGSNETVQLELINLGDEAVVFEAVTIFGGYSPVSINDFAVKPAFRLGRTPPHTANGTTFTEGTPKSLTEFIASGLPVPEVQPVVANIPTGALQGINFYYDRGDFNADHPGLPVEGYESGTMPYGSIGAIPHPLDEFSNNLYFNPGDILPGIQFWGSQDHDGDEIAVLGEQFFSNLSKTAVANYFDDSYRIVFDPPVLAAGMDLQEFLGGYSCQVDIYDSEGSLLGTDVSTCNEAGVFWGVSSNDNIIAMIVITSLAGGAQGADNIAFGGLPPEVSWLYVDPDQGTVPALDSLTLDVTFDASVPEITQPGLYYATLRFINDSPYGPLNVPVTMNVIPTETTGLLEGTVIGLGYCDDDPAPLQGAEVFIESDQGDTWTVTTDANGYFYIWLDEAGNPYTLTVSANEHEGAIAEDVYIVGQDTVTVDFDLRWLKPCMSVDPESLDVTLDFGDSTTLLLTLINDGGGEADFQVQTRPGGSGPLFFNGYVPEPLEQLPGYDPLTMTTEGLFASQTRQTSSGILAAGDVLTQWSSGQTLPWGTGFSLLEEMVWVNDNAAGGGSGLNEEFTVEGIITGKNFTPNFGGAWPGDMAYNLNTGMFWQVNVGGDNCIYEWDPAVPVATGNSLCGTWTWTSQRGLAHNPETDTFFIGGWNDSAVYEVDASGVTVKTCTMNLGISGLAYNWESGLLFAMLNASPNTIEVINWASCSVVDSITVAGGAFPAYSGAGMGIDCNGNLWAANQSNNQVFLIDSGVPANLCPGLDWLSVDQEEGSVPADSIFAVDVIFDASAVEEPGEYYATLKVHSNDPANSVIEIPVSMTVLPLPTTGKLDGTVTSLGYCDDNPVPLQESQVLIESSQGESWVVTTDSQGYYYRWLNEEGNPYTLTVTADEHEGVIAEGIVIVGQETTTVDFDLRWLVPCISVDPIAFDVEVVSGYSLTIPLDLTNHGAGELEFTLSKRPASGSTFAGSIDQATLIAEGSLMHTEEFKTISTTPPSSSRSSAMGGPDPFGYVFRDSLEADGPEYDWIEIAPSAGGEGSPIGLSGVDDGYFWPLTLPFSFNFYGIDYTQLAVASNGTLYFEDNYLGLWNTPIPSPTDYDVNTFIAHYWDDLVVDPGEVYYLALDDMFIVEYYQIRRYGTTGDHGTWQIVLFENGSILIQYKDASIGSGYNYGAEATVGIQGDEETGLQYSYNSPSLTDNLAICFAYPGEMYDCTAGEVLWIEVNPESGNIPPDDSDSIDITFTALTEIEIGQTVDAILRVNSNDPINKRIEIPVSMTVVEVAYGVELTAEQDALSGEPGETVDYTLTLINSGNVPDTFTLSIEGNDWEVSLPDEIMLAAGESVTIRVDVTIPEEAEDGDSDMVTITATSTGDASQFASVELTTTAVLPEPDWYFLFTPLIVKN